ncbi:MAG: hypothetical protein CMB31_02870 [Euryarchaeota archaeon]|nr:hypothetical protein [Euryarchaeota archaeon]|tara:strand:+ start:482 stop:1531 length:1050 start_codon:yes stop_codon:yes gene_type:complete
MPIVSNPNESITIEHPLKSQIKKSKSNGIYHIEIGTVCILKNTWILEFFNHLESLIDATLARRLAHASLSHTMNLDYSKWLPKKSFFPFQKDKKIIDAFERWAENRIYLGRGIVTPVNWPYSFHIEKPLMVSIEVGEICSFMQSLLGYSLRYQWRDDGGSNASVTFEQIDVPISEIENYQFEQEHDLEYIFDIDNGMNWPSRDGMQISIISTNVLHEFAKTINELNLKELDDPIIQINNLSGLIENILCMASINACSVDNQRYLLDSTEQFENWFENHINSNGLGKLTSCNYDDYDLSITFEPFIPWPIISGIILDAWQRSNGILGKIEVHSLSENNIEISIKSRRQIA